MLSVVDDGEKLKRTLYVSGQNREMWFLTEDGLYEVLMQSRKPIVRHVDEDDRTKYPITDNLGRTQESWLINESSVRNHLSKMNSKQAILIKNSDVLNKDIRKLNNAGEKFLTESGVYKLIFKSKKKEAKKFRRWVTSEVI